MESKRKAYLRACSLASSEVPLRTRSRYSTGLKTKHLRLRDHDLPAQYGFENSAAACRPSEGYEDIQSETNDVDFRDKSFYNYCTSSRDSVDESLDCDETQRSKDCLAKEALRLNDTNMSSSMNEEETIASKRYTILAGLWYSKQKPTMSTYMKPLVDKLNKLYKDGVEVNTPTGKIQVHCMVLMCSADLPAKAKVGNCVQYNGYNGCNTCDIYGTLVGRTVYWPYDPKATLRKHHEVLQYAEEATMTGKPVCGIYGMPVLALHPPFDTVLGMVLDILHALYIGVVPRC
eukprot:Em0003g917a